MQILKGHISPETAYVIDDYPYGFRLRCKIRYWIETVSGKGCRFWSQTSNPKRPGLVWNAPKASTYCRFGQAMFLDDKEHVHFSGLTEYTNGAEAAAWRDRYGEGVPDAARELMDRWVNAKLAYDAARANNKDAALSVGLAEAHEAFHGGR